MGALFGGWQGAPLDRIKLLGTAADAKAMLEKTVAALKADKAETVLFGKRRAEVPEHVRPEAVMLHVLRSQSGTQRQLVVTQQSGRSWV